MTCHLNLLTGAGLISPVLVLIALHQGTQRVVDQGEHLQSRVMIGCFSLQYAVHYGDRPFMRHQSREGLINVSCHILGEPGHR